MYRRFLVPSLFLGTLVGSLILPAGGPPLARWMVLWLAIGSVPVGLAILWCCFAPGKRIRAGIVAGFLFSAIFAAPALESFLSFAAGLQHESFQWQEAPLMVVRAAGAAYEITSPHPVPLERSHSPVEQLYSFIICVGIPEEMMKLLPLLVLLRIRYLRSLNDVWRVAAFSAFGFGVGESLWYCWYSMEFGTTPLTIYLGRLFGCPLAHVSFTLLAAFLFVKLACLWSGNHLVLKKLGRSVLLAALTVGGIHGLYDWLLSLNHQGPAGFLMASIGVAVLLLELLPGASPHIREVSRLVSANT